MIKTRRSSDSKSDRVGYIKAVNKNTIGFESRHVMAQYLLNNSGSLRAFISEAVRTPAGRRMADHTTVRRIQTAPALAVAVRVAADRTAGAVTGLDTSALGRDTFAAVGRDTFAGSKSDCAAGTRQFPCTRTTSPKPTRRSSRIQSSERIIR